VSFKDQIRSKDKYLSTFSRQAEAIVFLILQIFFVIRAVLKIGKYHSDIPQFHLGRIQSCDAFRLIARARAKIFVIDYN